MFYAMNDYIINNWLALTVLIIFIFVLIWLGWKIRLWWKNFLFMLSRRRGKLGEKNATDLLKKNGYKIFNEQISLKGCFFVDDVMHNFNLRPDLLVEKNGVEYIAEVKTGHVADPTNIYTRRQLYEYIHYSKTKTILLIDPIKMTIKRINFS